MKKISTFFAAALLLFAATNYSFAQGKHGDIGKLFGKHEANVLFGKVIGSVQFNVSDLQSAIDKAGDYMFFMVKHSQLIVADEKRFSLTDDKEEIGKDEVMYVFSKDEVKKLLQAGASSSKDSDRKGNVSTVSSAMATDVITAQVRASVLTLTYGAATLELSMACPPACW